MSLVQKLYFYIVVNFPNMCKYSQDSIIICMKGKKKSCSFHITLNKYIIHIQGGKKFLQPLNE